MTYRAMDSKGTVIPFTCAGTVEGAVKRARRGGVKPRWLVSADGERLRLTKRGKVDGRSVAS